MAGSTSGLAPCTVLRGCVPVRHAARGAPPAPAHTCTVPGSGRWFPPNPASAPALLGAEMERGRGRWKTPGCMAGELQCSLPKASVGNRPGCSISSQQQRRERQGGPAGPPGNGRTAGSQGEGPNQSQMTLCTHQPARPCGTGLVSRRRSHRGCQPLARLEESGWGSAPSFALLPLGEPGRRRVNRQATQTGAARSCCSPAFRRRAPESQPSAPTIRAFDTERK